MHLAQGSIVYDDQLFEQQRAWAEGALTTARNILPEMSPVATFLEWEPAQRQTLSWMLSASARTSESALLLCAWGQLWDAEVLVRSVLEGTLKFAYMLQARETFEERHREYTEDLFDISRLKDHRKALDLLESVGDPDGDEWRPMRDLLLSDEEVAEISGRLDKAARRALETRWGFTGLVGALSRSGDPYFHGLGALAHSYSLASHIQHADKHGTSIPLDRDMRSAERRDAIHLAHEGRLLSDVLHFLFMRLAVGYRFVGADSARLVTIKARIDEACEPFRQATEDWHSIEFGEVGQQRRAGSASP